MKYLKLAFVTALAAITFNSCIGDHGVGQGRDTEKNTYQVTGVAGGGPDTAYIIHNTGDSIAPDNSASGGANLIKPDSNIKK